jgi:predicted Zn-dependent protease with MMP-like domain
VPLRRRGAQARRNPTRRVTLPSATEREHERFEDLVAAALDRLPPEVQKLLENVAVVIADEPTPEQLGSSGLHREDTLYGLYEGVSPATYGADWATFPNKITIFRLSLEEDFPDPEELADEVRRTVLHELGHHAGLDHLRLRRAGYR